MLIVEVNILMQEHLSMLYTHQCYARRRGGGGTQYGVGAFILLLSCFLSLGWQFSLTLKLCVFAPVNIKFLFQLD